MKRSSLLRKTDQCERYWTNETELQAKTYRHACEKYESSSIDKLNSNVRNKFAS